MPVRPYHSAPMQEPREATAGRPGRPLASSINIPSGKNEYFELYRVSEVQFHVNLPAEYGETQKNFD